MKHKRNIVSEWKLISRAFKILNKLFPNFWILETVCAIFETLVPFFGLVMSSYLVNELSGSCDEKRLLFLAMITVTGGFFLSMVSKWLQSRQRLMNSFMFQRHEAYLLAVQNKLQYEHLENPDMIVMRFKNLENMSTFHAGLCAVKDIFPKMIGYIFQIVFSVSLTVSMFTIKAEGSYTGILKFVNSRASILVILIIILVNAFFSILISIKRAEINNEANGELAVNNSRIRSYNRRWGSDMITFKLNDIVLEEYQKHLLKPKWISKVEKATIQYNTCSILLNGIMTISVFLFTAAKAFIGVFGIGNFILYQGTIERFVKAVSGIAIDIGKLFHNNQYLEELYEFLDLPNTMYKGTLAVEKRDDIEYVIEFRDVSFRYPKTNEWALRHVNLQFKIGDKLAIVGENGSGKTTFIKLLCRLYDPTEGKILLNGIDITRYRYQEYIALFSVVFQDYSLSGFPLGENVAANHEYDEEKVRDCLIRAGMEEKLNSMGKDALKQAIGRAYDSQGIDFSGGELQKIALARALYKDAPFVILDEPTAALDPIAEAAVYENFNVLVKEKTSIFISHRLSSCRFCDEIAVFDKGRMVENGTHEELVAGNGKYQELWEAQAKYYRNVTA